jgi:hypothetical protein
MAPKCRPLFCRHGALVACMSPCQACPPSCSPVPLSGSPWLGCSTLFGSRTYDAVREGVGEGGPHRSVRNHRYGAVLRESSSLLAPHPSAGPVRAYSRHWPFWIEGLSARLLAKGRSLSAPFPVIVCDSHVHDEISSLSPIMVMCMPKWDRGEDGYGHAWADASRAAPPANMFTGCSLGTCSSLSLHLDNEQKVTRWGKAGPCCFYLAWVI